MADDKNSQGLKKQTKKRALLPPGTLRHSPLMDRYRRHELQLELTMGSNPMELV